MQVTRKQAAMEEILVELPTGEKPSARYFPSEVSKFPKITFEWQLLQLESATFDEKCKCNYDLIKNMNYLLVEFLSSLQ